MLSVLKFAILYCIIFCLCSSDARASNTSLSKTTEKSCVTFCLADTPDFFCHTINAGMSAGTAIQAGFKNPYPGFLDITQLKQPDQRLKFSFYILLSGNLLTGLRKSDIIYPFHYFW